MPRPVAAGRRARTSRRARGRAPRGCRCPSCGARVAPAGPTPSSSTSTRTEPVRSRADGRARARSRTTPARAGPRWPAPRARRRPRRRRGPARPARPAGPRRAPPSTTRRTVEADDERRREAEARPREGRLPPQPLDQAGGGVRVAQVVHDLTDLPHRAVDVVERLVDDRGQLGGVHAAGGASADGLQLQARREQLLDGEVVQVARDALALVEQRGDVLGVPCRRPAT